MMRNNHPILLYGLGIIFAVLAAALLWPAVFAAAITVIPALVILFVMGMLFELFRDTFTPNF